MTSPLFYGTLSVSHSITALAHHSSHSAPGIMPALLQEIVSVYPMLSPPNLTAHVSNRVCNALALLQCVASHPETRQLFLNGICLHSCIFVRTPATDAFKKISTYTPLLVPVLEYNFQNTSIRVPAPHLPRCHRRSRQGGLPPFLFSPFFPSLSTPT